MTKTIKSTKPMITEAKLRKIVRDELARQVLISEGFLDAIKNPFSKLSEKAKAWVTEKVTEVIASLKNAFSQMTKPEGLDEFWKNFQSAEGGMSKDALADQVGLTKTIGDLSEEKISSDLDASLVADGSSKNESMAFNKLKLDVALIEEEYEQRKESNILTEAIVTSLLAGWWTVTKTIIGTAGLVIAALKIASKIFKFFKKDKIAERLSHYAHVVHELETKFAKVFVYPAPVAYAAYVAASAVKKVGATATGKTTEKLLSYEEFNLPENKEKKQSAEKLMHIALLSAIVIEAITHLVHAVHELMTHTLQAAKTVAHSGAEIGIEGSGVVKGAAGAARAGTEVVRDISNVGRAAAIAGSQV